MARPSKPAVVLESEKRSHRSKAELEQREENEAALLSGKRCFERERVKNDPVAHKEYKRIIGLMRAIGKDDALYAPEYNRYCELFSEEEFYKGEIAAIQNEFAELRGLSANAAAAAETISRRIETADGCTDLDALTAVLKDLLENINQLHEQRGKLLKQLSDMDLKIKQKREAMFAIEKENCMTVSAALRTIPKDVRKSDSDDALLKALMED